MEAVPYQPSLRAEWETVLDQARNGLFQFRRDFVEYHSDRFRELSFLFRHGGKTIGLVAGHLDGANGWASHRGLTHGGIVAISDTRTPEIQAMFEALHLALQVNGVIRVCYKPLPWWLHNQPSQADLWILQQYGAQRQAVWLNTLVPLNKPPKVSALRRRGASRSQQAGLEIVNGDYWKPFWHILSERLAQRHGVLPVHSLLEIELLSSRFPQNIRLWCALENGEVRAGIVGFLSPTTFHVQYSASDDRGRELGALDALALNRLQDNTEGRSWLSFGTSCEKGGTILNQGLLAWKEGFGGQAAIYEELSYELPPS